MTGPLLFRACYNHFYEEVITMSNAENWRLETDSRIPEKFNQYAVVFDDSSLLWKDAVSSNETYLKQVVDYANDKLNKYGYLFLSDVMFLLNKTELVRKAAVVGWTFEGDGFVEFEVFKDPEEKYIVIDFNVDGLIV